MTGIEADAHSRRAAKSIDDVGEMFEAISERASLPRRMLQQHHRGHVRSASEREAERFCHEREGVNLAAGCAGARVEDDAEQAQRVRAVDFID